MIYYIGERKQGIINTLLKINHLYDPHKNRGSEGVYYVYQFF
nr:MAG TPA: hypothetical protein [Caudoviricetes sp.]